MHTTKTADEITLRHLLFRTQEYLYYFLKHWYWIGLGALLVAAYFYVGTLNIQPTYNAKVVSLLRVDDSAKNNVAIILTFSKVANSRLIIERTLFDQAEIEGHKDYLINHYLKIYEKHYPGFTNLKLPADFHFEGSDIADFDRLHLEAFNEIVEKIITPQSNFSDGFVSVSLEEKLGFITINFSSPNQELSAHFVQQIIKNLEELYEETILLPKQTGVLVVSQEIDSLNTKVKAAISRLSKLKKKKKTRESEARSQLEFDITSMQKQLDVWYEQRAYATKELGQQTPVIVVTERPVLPLKPYLPSPIWFIIKGLVIGATLSVFVLTGLKIVLDTLKE